MNACIGTFSSVFEELKQEAYRVKYYMQSRFKDITTIIKSHPGLAAASFLVFACSIYLTSIRVFSIMFVVNYLENTYFTERSGSRALCLLCSELQSLKDYIPLSPSKEEREEVLEEFSDDPEDLEFFLRWWDVCQKRDQEMLEKQAAYANDSRPVVLILKAKSDDNNAFDLFWLDQSITINGDNDIGVDELKIKYKIVLVDKITTVDQIKVELGKIVNKIQQVWIFAHGSPTSMLLDGDNKIGNSEIDQLADVMQQKLSDEAHVILKSCRTGQKLSSGENIATKFSRSLPGRTIWAATQNTDSMNLDLGEDFSATVSLWKTKSRLAFLNEKMWNIFCLQPFKTIELKWQVTAQIKDGMYL